MLTERLNADARGIARAAALLRAGALVAFPTETVYGLGANALDRTAVARVYAAKGRPEDNPLIVHLADATEIGRWAVGDLRAYRLAETFWPGPLTLVLPGRGLFGASTIALRMPREPIARELLRLAARPIAAPSANRSGRPSPTTAAAAAADLQDRIEAVLWGPAANVGIESTVVDLSVYPAAILRPGGVSSAAVSAALGEEVTEARGSARSPGTRYRHYAPRVPVRCFDGAPALVRDAVAAALAEDPGSVYIGLAEMAPPGARGLLAPDLPSLQRGLYAALLEAERRGRAVLAALPPTAPESEGVRDRLRRAGGGNCIAVGDKPEEGAR